MEKVCSKCGILKPYEEFNTNSNGRGIGGRRSNCKACDTKRSKDRRDKLRDTVRKTITHKTCYTCKEKKPVSEFGKNNSLKDGFNSNCKICNNKKHKENADKRKLKDKESFDAVIRKSRLKTKYGITVEQFDEMFERQHGKCEVCSRELVKERHGKTGSTMNVAVIDHCHTTGKVRGILCNNCNTALGLLNEDIQAIQNLIDYKKKWVDKK